MRSQSASSTVSFSIDFPMTSMPPFSSSDSPRRGPALAGRGEVDGTATVVIVVPARAVLAAVKVDADVGSLLFAGEEVAVLLGDRADDGFGVGGITSFERVADREGLAPLRRAGCRARDSPLLSRRQRRGLLRLRPEHDSLRGPCRSWARRFALRWLRPTRTKAPVVTLLEDASVRRLGFARRDVALLLLSAMLPVDGMIVVLERRLADFVDPDVFVPFGLDSPRAVVRICSESFSVPAFGLRGSSSLLMRIPSCVLCLHRM